ncbi:MAG: 16S rRNA (uracil(1498)-N(3))-methyltransferase [Candidatus Cloacimonadota bacterium]|nr:MAG: 16S rRNA (uracil(1498)-N(3))-methyltransferase [Candidatus Cloacimonadota bacterium]
MGYFLVKKKDIEGDRVVIKGKEFRHIKNVLRARIDDKIVVITGDGEEYHSFISEIKSNYIVAHIAKITRRTHEPGIYAAIAIAPPKARRMEWFVEKATEIGVSEIIPVVTMRSVVIPGSAKVIRWKRIAVSSVKQSERSILPKIREVVSFEELLFLSQEFPFRFIAYEKERKRAFEEYLDGKGVKKVLTLIGPEGGFEDWEVKVAVERGFSPVKLGEAKLRTETAGIVALTRILAM